MLPSQFLLFWVAGVGTMSISQLKFTIHGRQAGECNPWSREKSVNENQPGNKAIKATMKNNLKYLQKKMNIINKAREN